jgi:hypothetical protein
MAHVPDDLWCPRCYGDGCTSCVTPRWPRCCACGGPSSHGDACSKECAARLAEDFAAFGAGAEPEDAQVYAAAEAERAAWRHGRDF